MTLTLIGRLELLAVIGVVLAAVTVLYRRDQRQLPPPPDRILWTGEDWTDPRETWGGDRG